MGRQGLEGREERQEGQGRGCGGRLETRGVRGWDVCVCGVKANVFSEQFARITAILSRSSYFDLFS